MEGEKMKTKSLFALVIAGLLFLAVLITFPNPAQSAAVVSKRTALQPPIIPKMFPQAAITTPIGVAITGSLMDVVYAGNTFTAIITPSEATLPISYTWEATGQTPVVHTGGLTDAVTFAWNMTGIQIITVTAQNAGGMVTDTHTITIGLNDCANPISDQSFEISLASTKWFYRRPGSSYNGVTRTSDGANSGSFSIRAATHDVTWYNPYFYQKFTMPRRSSQAPQLLISICIEMSKHLWRIPLIERPINFMRWWPPQITRLPGLL
jgi:hypothetical protein